jgi:L-ribulose-5-phosphate 4-epimerase
VLNKLVSIELIPAVFNVLVICVFISVGVNPAAPVLKEALKQKHYDRKHGANKYYGQ